MKNVKLIAQRLLEGVPPSVIAAGIGVSKKNIKRVSEVLTQLRSGMKASHASKGNGMSPGDACAIAHLANIPLRQGGGPLDMCGSMSRKEVIALREQNLTLQDIADRAGVSRERIRQVLVSEKYTKPRETKSTLAENLLKNGFHDEDVAREVGLSLTFVGAIRRKLGIMLVRNSSPLYDRSWLVHEYVTNNKSQGQIAQELGITYLTVARWMHIHGIPIRSGTLAVSGRNKKHIPESEQGPIKQAFVNGESMHSIARRYKVSLIAIRRILRPESYVKKVDPDGI